MIEQESLWVTAERRSGCGVRARRLSLMARWFFGLPSVFIFGFSGLSSSDSGTPFGSCVLD